MLNTSLEPMMQIYLFYAGCFLISFWLASVLYLKHKWLPFVENVVDENNYSFSSNFFLQV